MHQLLVQLHNLLGLGHVVPMQLLQFSLRLFSSSIAALQNPLVIQFFLIVFTLLVGISLLTGSSNALPLSSIS